MRPGVGQGALFVLLHTPSGMDRTQSALLGLLQARSATASPGESLIMVVPANDRTSVRGSGLQSFVNLQMAYVNNELLDLRGDD